MRTTLKFRRLIPLSVLSSLLCAGQAARAQWSQYQGNAAHTGYAAETVSGNRLAKGWDKTFNYNGQTTTHSDVVISSQGVFTTEYQKRVTIDGDSSFYQYAIVGLDRATGQEKWQTPVLSYGPGGVKAPALDNNTIYASAVGHSGAGSTLQYPKIVGTDIRTGQTTFSMTHAGQWDETSRPTVLGGQVVALGGYYGGMDSYSAGTGVHQWFIGLPQQFNTTPAMDAQRAYVYYGGASASPGPNVGTLYAINRVTGNLDYSIANPSDGGYYTPSSVLLGGMNDALAIANGPGFGARQITAFNLQNHGLNWNRSMNPVNSLAVAGGIVAVPLQNSLKMLSEVNGADIWTWNAPGGVSLSSNVVLTDNLAFIASNDTLFGVDRLTGALGWSAYVGVDGAVNGSQPYNLAYYGGALYASGSTRLITFNAVPEPSTILLCGGIFAFTGGLIARRRVRR